MDAAGAKFGMPLTVPWPPHVIHGVKSEISPSKRRNGNGRDVLTDGSLLIKEERRTSFETLPPQLRQTVISMLETMRKHGYHIYHVREFDAAQVRCLAYYSLDYSRRHVQSSRIRWKVVQKEWNLAV